MRGLRDRIERMKQTSGFNVMGYNEAIDDVLEIIDTSRGCAVNGCDGLSVGRISWSDNHTFVELCAEHRRLLAALPPPDPRLME